jgi:hypothetical protein
LGHAPQCGAVAGHSRRMLCTCVQLADNVKQSDLPPHR